MRRPSIILFLAAFSLLFVLGELFFVPKTYVNSMIVQALQAPGVFFRSIANQHRLIEQLKEGQLENQSLRAKLITVANQPSLLKIHRVEHIQASVYSQYPLSSIGRLIVSAGKDEGVREGQIVVAAPDVFLGEVVKVHAHQSEIRTLYDLGWELPVKIGPGKIDSLLLSGHEPRLTLISKKKPAESGMDVYLASSQYSYGLLVGSMGDPSDSEKNLFQEAALSLPYDMNDLNVVYIRLTE